jgi:hypothetical protein
MHKKVETIGRGHKSLKMLMTIFIYNKTKFFLSKIIGESILDLISSLF